MRKIVMLNSNSDFKSLYYRGKYKVHPLLVTYVLSQTARRHPRIGPGMSQKKVFKIPGDSRIGITTSKKIGNAVQRNRSRRIIKQAYIILLPQIDKGWDIVFVARNQTPKSNTNEVMNIMKKHLTVLGVINKKH